MRSKCRDALRRTSDLLRDLDRLHRRGRFHGGICPAAVRWGVFGATLSPPGRGSPPPEYRDPERARSILRDPEAAHRAAPRQDVYSIGALLYAWLEGGPPSCGPASPFTRPVPVAVAWIAHRAMADGARRYPDARTMRRDVECLRRRDPEKVRPEDLPSCSGAAPGAVRSVSPFPALPVHRILRPRRRRPVLAALAVAALLLMTLGGDPDPVPGAKAGEPGLPGLVAEWRDRLDDRLRASGEGLGAGNVPLLVVADVPVPDDLGWRRHPSELLAGAVRAMLRDDVDPEEVQRVLLRLAGEETLPAVLWVRPGSAKGEVEARLYYRGVVLRGATSGLSSAATAVFRSPRRSKIDMKPM